MSQQQTTDQGHCLPHSQIHTSFNKVISSNYHITYVYTCVTGKGKCTHVSNLVGSLCCTTVNKEDGNVVGGHLGKQVETSLTENLSN